MDYKYALVIGSKWHYQDLYKLLIRKSTNVQETKQSMCELGYFSLNIFDCACQETLDVVYNELRRHAFVHGELSSDELSDGKLIEVINADDISDYLHVVRRIFERVEKFGVGEFKSNYPDRTENFLYAGNCMHCGNTYDNLTGYVKHLKLSKCDMNKIVLAEISRLSKKIEELEQKLEKNNK